MAYGPHGVGHLDGQVVFVRGVAPGERVRITVDERYGRYAYAHAEEILSASPRRRVPPCPYLPRCGGCPWQHLEYSAQLEAKQDNVRDHLQRIAKIPDPPLEPPIPSPREFGYRSRLSLRAEHGAVGFYAAASHELVPIERCLLGTDAINEALPSVQELVQQLTSNVRRVEVVADAHGSEIALALEIQGSWLPSDDRVLFHWLERVANVRGIVLQSKRARRIHNDPRVLILPCPEVALVVTAGVFAQVNADANPILVDAVIRFLAPRVDERIVDAYAGVGNFTFPLARHSAEVIAVEADPAAAADFHENMRRLDARNVHLVHDSAERALRMLAERGERIDALVLDPPRSGVREALPAILTLRPKRIVYVSCNSATFARDLATLSSRYRLLRLQAIDLFPQTYHVETVALLVLTC